MKSSYIDAVMSLVPGAQVSCVEETGEIDWHKPSVAPVTFNEIENERERLGSLQMLNQYMEKRKREYPPIGDQLDALWKGGVDAEAMLAQVMAVKAKYPKPEGA
jgi:hypothetical protein